MFLTQFFENFFSNSKSRSAPSFAIPFILSWFYCNDEFWKTFLSVTGSYSVKLSRAFEMNINVSDPILLTLAIVFMSPFIMNLSIFVSEFADDGLKKIIRKMKIKSFYTTEEYDRIHRDYENMKSNWQSTTRGLSEETEKNNGEKLALRSEFDEQMDHLTKSFTSKIETLERDYQGRVDLGTSKNLALNEELSKEKEQLKLTIDSLNSSHRKDIDKVQVDFNNSTEEVIRLNQIIINLENEIKIKSNQGTLSGSENTNNIEKRKIISEAVYGLSNTELTEKIKIFNEDIFGTRSADMIKTNTPKD